MLCIRMFSCFSAIKFDLLQARALNGNAVLGYQQHFDFEGDSGVVARAYGTVFRYENAFVCMLYQ